ncbi:SAM hydrolase/SAM-dependent halogenase family protein [Riemerella columbipharyngis]|uniref:S-adenosyl-l-methionine hydroxide adenosyltransferase n=1 Tax=Riemerella columbipharyngis TaxID=1071918 RepID=A0A1G6YPQ3_9FLAO|nr:SAM-dependent chlorinase/fluorinase [Riemerella columbipharyngis]SDD92290.1 hypothetical protein SAMN05421544_101228 [Riemerella columbipharyngis]
MPVITLTSDYGLTDHRVASIKGRILSLDIEAKVVDVTHNIKPYDIKQAAYIVRNAYHYFPKGSVHIIFVDSFYHKDRKLILYQADGHYFIAADNGILGLIFYDIVPEKIFEITVNNRFDDEVKFTGTDIFVPAAVHLHKGGLPEVIGRPYKEPKEVSAMRPVYNETGKMIIGKVIYIDNFDNAVTNISRNFFEKIKIPFSRFCIKSRGYKITEIYNHYTEMISDWSEEKKYQGNKAYGIFNDENLIEIAIYKSDGNSGANNLLGLHIEETVYIEFYND